MSETAAPYTVPTCWCRNCDRAARANLSPLENLRAGSRFIVCPDCGNKRCPKGTSHELACTNSNLPGQVGSEWENIKPPSHYADRPTATLQARRDMLLRLPRDFTPDERGEVRAIEAELVARNVLSIGIEF